MTDDNTTEMTSNVLTHGSFHLLNLNAFEQSVIQTLREAFPNLSEENAKGLAAFANIMHRSTPKQGLLKAHDQLKQALHALITLKPDLPHHDLRNLNAFGAFLYPATQDKDLERALDIIKCGMHPLLTIQPTRPQ
jgi:hypothetical protein